MVLFRLLSGLAHDRYCLISSGRKQDTQDFGVSDFLPANYHYLPKVRQLPPVANKILSALFICINTLWVVFRRSRQIEEVAKREGCESLVACTGDFYDLPATFLACRRLKIGFIPYIFDDYAYQWLGFRRRIAKQVEPVLLKGAAAIIVPNEYLQKEYVERHGINSTVIHNPCPLPDLEQLDATPRIFQGGINIVYTGAIYHAHYDAFLNLVEALKLLNRPEIKLHLFTAQAERDLEDQGITGPHVVYHPHVPQREVDRILRQADVLFLPLAFSSPIPEVIRTSAPGKTGEYLAAGRVTLVHAPADSFVSWYFRDNVCGIVVDSEDPVRLAEALTIMVNDQCGTLEIATRARKMAERDFDLEVVHKAFISLLEVKSGDSVDPISTHMAE